MIEYKFKSQWQEESERKQKIKLAELKQKTKDNALKEATFSVSTVDGALITIQKCMELIAMKKRNPMVFTDLIASAVIGGIDGIVKEFEHTGETEKQEVSLADRCKRRIVATIRSSIGEAF